MLFKKGSTWFGKPWQKATFNHVVVAKCNLRRGLEMPLIVFYKWWLVSGATDNAQEAIQKTIVLGGGYTNQKWNCT